MPVFEALYVGGVLVLEVSYILRTMDLKVSSNLIVLVLELSDPQIMPFSIQPVVA